MKDITECRCKRKHRTYKAFANRRARATRLGAGGDVVSEPVVG